MHVEEEMPSITLRTILILLVICLISFAGYQVLNMKDKRASGERMGDAIDAISGGASKAGEQLQDRTPLEKLGDTVKSVGDDINEKTNQ